MQNIWYEIPDKRSLDFQRGLKVMNCWTDTFFSDFLTICFPDNDYVHCNIYSQHDILFYQSNKINRVSQSWHGISKTLSQNKYSLM